jgi:hypothetical protein
MHPSAFAVVLGTLLLLVACAVSPDAEATPRFKFMAYDGDPKQTEAKGMHFQILLLEVGQRTQFLQIGETIRGTQFKLHKFQFKTRAHPTYGEVDASELTLINTATNETLVLALGSPSAAGLRPK